MYLDQAVCDQAVQGLDSRIDGCGWVAFTRWSLRSMEWYYLWELLYARAISNDYRRRGYGQDAWHLGRGSVGILGIHHRSSKEMMSEVAL